MRGSLLALRFVRAEGFPLGKDPFGGACMGELLLEQTLHDKPDLTLDSLLNLKFRE